MHTTHSNVRQYVRECLILFLILLIQLVAVRPSYSQQSRITINDLYEVSDTKWWGYVHPYLTLAGQYDDNVYSKSVDEVGDYATVFSPGIWLGFPASRERIVGLNTSTLKPGGLGMLQEKQGKFRRMRAYLHYGADLTRWGSETQNDTDDQRLEGVLQYNFRGGLSLGLLDVFQDAHEGWAQGFSEDLDTYTSNLLAGRIQYDLGTRFRVRAEYSNFLVDYDDADKSIGDRRDNSYSVYCYYKYSPKTSLYGQYKFLDVRYDQIEGLDSSDHYLYAGLRWRLTGRTTGEFKAGYVARQYDNPDLRQQNDFSLEGWTSYQISSKTALRLTLSRLYQQPTVRSPGNVLANIITLGYRQKLGAKIDLVGSLGYTQKDHRNILVGDDTLQERKDKEYRFGIGLSYTIQKWWSVVARYEFFKRDSNFSDLSYTDNRAILRLTFTL